MRTGMRQLYALSCHVLVWTNFVLATITLSIKSTPIAEGPPIEVMWTRESTDPVFSAIRKVKLDELDGRPLPSVPIPIANPEALSGSVSVSFNRAGVIRIEALVLSGRSDRAPSTVAFGPDFGVMPPGSSPISTTTAASPNFPTSSSPETRQQASPSAKVAGSIVGVVAFLLIVGGGGLFYVRRRRWLLRASQVGSMNANGIESADARIAPFDMSHPADSILSRTKPRLAPTLAGVEKTPMEEQIREVSAGLVERMTLLHIQSGQSVEQRNQELEEQMRQMQGQLEFLTSQLRSRTESTIHDPPPQYPLSRNPSGNERDSEHV